MELKFTRRISSLPTRNGLLLSPANRQYDRIYCGAAVPQEHSHLLKNLLNMNGILIMPTEQQVFV